MNRNTVVFLNVISFVLQWCLYFIGQVNGELDSVAVFNWGQENLFKKKDFSMMWKNIFSPKSVYRGVSERSSGKSTFEGGHTVRFPHASHKHFSYWRRNSDSAFEAHLQFNSFLSLTFHLQSSLWNCFVCRILLPRE